MYRFIRETYRILPRSFRGWVQHIRGLRATKEAFKRFLAKVCKADSIYDRNFYLHRQAWNLSASAAIIAKSLMWRFSPTSVLDAGCGSGELLLELKKYGVRILGLEISAAAIEICREKDLPVRKFDLTRDMLNPTEIFDLAVSLEVAEHLPKCRAPHYVDVLTSAAPTVVISAARPGQGGEGHLNEQPSDYWISLFESKGFCFSHDDTHWLRDFWGNRHVKPWYVENVLCFRRQVSV